ncbi:phospholipid scramblase 3-like [Ornithodoros turicata]|uniref:phospholipid scramblase 3-like n=1 Tax=Ornithodoros turicata TaxID=34597 RepID=UPI003139A43A
MFMTYTDASGNKCLAMVFRRPMRLQSGVKGCCCGCLGQEMQVETPDGTTIASIVEDNTTWGTSLTIRDASGMPILKVIGPALPPYCCCNCCCKCCYALATFKVKSMAGTPLGEIKTDGYHYVDLSFPTDLDVHLKSTLIGCGFLIWCMFHPDGCIMHACLELLVGCLLCNFFCQRYGRAFEIFT